MKRELTMKPELRTIRKLHRKSEELMVEFNVIQQYLTKEKRWKEAKDYEYMAEHMSSVVGTLEDILPWGK